MKKRARKRPRRNPHKQLALAYPKRATPPRGMLNLLAHAKKHAAKKKRRRKARGGGGGVHVTLLGKAQSIIYRHAHGGTYRHRFGASTRVAFTKDGSKLILWPVRRQDFIGD